MRVLVTGASGFIGCRVVARLQVLGESEVVTVSRHTEGAGTIHECADLLAPGAASALIDKVRPDRLIHLAWNAEPGKFWNANDNLDWMATTAMLMREFFERGGHRAVAAGTCAEYDWTGAGRLSETSDVGPATIYGVCKDATRRSIQSVADKAGWSFAWGRIFWLYGPGEAGGRLVSDVCKALSEGRPVEVSEGLHRRDFLHVDQVAAAFVAALDSAWRGPFNIGSGHGVPIREIALQLGEISGRPDLLKFGARPQEQSVPPLLEADTTILHDQIGFVPDGDLTRGLADTYSSWLSR